MTTLLVSLDPPTMSAPRSTLPSRILSCFQTPSGNSSGLPHHRLFAVVMDPPSDQQVHSSGPTRTPSPTLNGAQTVFYHLTSVAPDKHMPAHTIVTVVIFTLVCLLLLLALLYAFCVHCSIRSTPKDPAAPKESGLEREDATYKNSSSDDQSVGNVI